MDLETTIVGAGPYGLSIAAHLTAAAIPFKIFGTPLESWRNFMPDGMILKSEPFASNLWDPKRHFSLKRYMQLTGQDYQPVGSPLSRKLFLEYASWFRDNTLPEIDETKVVRIDSAPAGFVLDLADGRTFTSRRVVIATGHMAFCVAPDEIAHLPESRAMHSTRLAGTSDYVARDVTIIGAGQSALETAAILHESGAYVRVLARRNRLEWNATSKPRSLFQRILHPDAGVASGWKSWAVSELPRIFRWYFPPTKRHRFVAGSYGPSGSWWLRPRVDGRIRIDLQSRIESATLVNDQIDLLVRRPGATERIRSDYIIAATGYRVDMDKLQYLTPALRHRIIREGVGIPALTANFETSVTGLYIAGIASSPTFGPIMRFMYGAKHAAPIIANHLSIQRRR